MHIPEELRLAASNWDVLLRGERVALACGLRTLGLSYEEIRGLLPVPKSTLSTWCSQITLTDEQTRRILSSQSHQDAARRRGMMLHQRNQERLDKVRKDARKEAETLSSDPRWTAGVALYWAEGAKRHNVLLLTNSDPALVNVFIRWCQDFHDVTTDRFRGRLQVHGGQDPAELEKFWSRSTNIPLERFSRTHVKSKSTSRRKNPGYLGTFGVSVSRSSDLVHVTLEWIDTLRAIHSTSATLGH